VIERRTSAELEAKTGLTIGEHHIVFSGLCTECGADEAQDHTQ
jgi:Fe2+ or Zn2+ uptake regulation protein